jgi:hypothetical protein
MEESDKSSSSQSSIAPSQLSSAVLSSSSASNNISSSSSSPVASKKEEKEEKVASNTPAPIKPEENLNGFLQSLLASNQGLILGEQHFSRAPIKFIIDNIGYLKTLADRHHLYIFTEKFLIGETSKKKCDCLMSSKTTISNTLKKQHRPAYIFFSDIPEIMQYFDGDIEGKGKRFKCSSENLAVLKAALGITANDMDKPKELSVKQLSIITSYTGHTILDCDNVNKQLKTRAPFVGEEKGCPYGMKKLIKVCQENGITIVGVSCNFILQHEVTFFASIKEKAEVYGLSAIDFIQQRIDIEGKERLLYQARYQVYLNYCKHPEYFIIPDTERYGIKNFDSYGRGIEGEKSMKLWAVELNKKIVSCVVRRLKKNVGAKFIIWVGSGHASGLSECLKTPSIFVNEFGFDDVIIEGQDGSPRYLRAGEVYPPPEQSSCSLSLSTSVPTSLASSSSSSSSSSSLSRQSTTIAPVPLLKFDVWDRPNPSISPSIGQMSELLQVNYLATLQVLPNVTSVTPLRHSYVVAFKSDDEKEERAWLKLIDGKMGEEVRQQGFNFQFFSLKSQLLAETPELPPAPVPFTKSSSASSSH